MKILLPGGLALLLVIGLFVPFSVFRKKTREIRIADIVGKWRKENQTAKIFENGNIVLTNRRRNKSSAGRYELIDKDIIRVALDGKSPQDFRLSLSKDTLTVRGMEKRVVNKYRRVT
jgi:hypothetical protein